MSFRTQYERIAVTSNTGTPYLDSYKQSVDGDGKIILVKSGRDNIQDKIQAERSSCELKQILARLSSDEVQKFDILNGGMFGDFTKVPKNIRQLRERMLDAESMFKSLPVNIREQFDFSTDKFFSSIGTDFYNKVMAPLFEKSSEVSEKTVESEVKE